MFRDRQTEIASKLNYVRGYCLYIKYNDDLVSAVVLTEQYAATTFHCIPEEFRILGFKVVLNDANGREHQCVIYGMNSVSDYVVFKNDGLFEHCPKTVTPYLLEKYIAVVSLI